jgi:hypothetical protein
MKRTRIMRCCITAAEVLALAWLALPELARGQESRGTIVGRIADAAAGAVPSAELQLTNKATGAVLTGASNEAGAFRFPYLVPGTYSLSAQKPGFKQFTRDGIEIRVADVVEVDVVLTIGELNERVEVTAEAPPLATSDSSLGTVVTRASITELPIRDGSPAELALLTPGMVNTQSLRQRKAYTTLAISEISSNGTGSLSNQFTIDGIPNYASDRIAFSPPTTAVQEFKVQTATYDAGSGFTMGATVNMVTVGGTNALHGEAHEWFRNKSLDANSFFNNMAGRQKDNYRDNRFGASAGGPIIIPKLYNGKNKSFWFFAYEGNPNSVPAEGTVTTVATAKERTGDFSELLPFGSAYQIYDPSSIHYDGTHYVRDPYPGNKIPSSALSPVAKNIVDSYYPLPNQDPQTAVGFRRNFRSPRPLNENRYNTYTSRVDHAFSDRHRLFGRFSMDRWFTEGGDLYGNIATGTITERKNRVAALDDVVVLSPSAVLDLRYGYTRVLFPLTQRSTGQVADILPQLGFSSGFTSLMSAGTMAFPTMSIDSGNYGGFANGTDRRVYNDTHSLSGTLSWTRGSHNIRFGADYRVERLNGGVQTRDNSPRVNFNNMWTKGPYENSVGQPIGGGLASFLLGLPDSTGFMMKSANFALQSIREGFFVQDDWKVSSKLTLNLGLRYELDNPMTERYNRFIKGFDPTAELAITQAVESSFAANPIPGVPSLNVRGGDVYAGTDGRGAWSLDKTNIMPRLGLAYQIDSKTVFRAGVGKYSDTLGVNALTPSWNNNQLRLSQNGFSATTYVIPSVDNGQHFLASLGNPFPNGLNQPVGSARGINTDVGNGLPLVYVNAKNPHVWRFSAGFQRQLPASVVLDVSYVGSRGGDLYSNGEVNVIPDISYMSTTGTRNQALIDFMDEQVPSPFIVNGVSLLAGTTLGGQTVSRSQLLRAFPQYASEGGDTSKGESWYNALEVSAERRFSKGLTLNGTFTWQKNMAAQWDHQWDSIGFKAPYEKVIDGSDPGKRFTFNAVYELPFGRGRQFGSNWHGLVNGLMGGWQIGSILRMQGGMPVPVGNMLLLPGRTMREAVLPKSQRTWQQWFNYDIFDMNPDDQLAWNLRTLSSYYGFLRGPGYVLLDGNLSKNFSIKERAKLQFRAEAFNATNHTNFGGDTTPSIDTWGTDAGSVAAQNGYPRNIQLALRLTF